MAPRREDSPRRLCDRARGDIPTSPCTGPGWSSCSSPRKGWRRNDRGRPATHGDRRPGQFPDLARAEAEARIQRVPSRKRITESCNSQGRCMAGHMPSICKKRHGTKKHSCNNFQHHHSRCEAYDDLSSTFARAFFFTGEHELERHELIGSCPIMASPDPPSF